MKQQLQVLLCLILSSSLSLFNFPCTSDAKSTIEPCNSSDSCTSLVSYIPPYDSKLSEIAYRFQANISDILAANNVNPATQPSSDRIFHARSRVKIPISCSCVDGIRRSISTTYAVRAADTVDSISEAYGGLVSAEQIESINGISTKNPLMNSQKLVIPLPCTCFSNTNNGVPAVYMSYVVQNGESLGSIAMEFSTTIGDLEAVNGLGQPAVDPGDILAIPISACSSANLNWYNESLIVPNGSYALTANNCIKCACRPGNLDLSCSLSGILGSCSYLQCKGSDLFIGYAHVEHGSIGCNISTCVYRGHYGRKIFSSLVNYSHVHCPGNGTHYGMSPTPMVSPSANPVVPSIKFPPSPSSAPHPSMGIDGSISPTNTQISNISGDVKLFRQAFWCFLLFSGVVIVIIL